MWKGCSRHARRFCNCLASDEADCFDVLIHDLGADEMADEMIVSIAMTASSGFGK